MSEVSASAGWGEAVEESAPACGDARPTESRPTQVCKPAGELTFRVPESDMEFFRRRVPVKVQERVDLLLNALQSIHAAPIKTQECKRLAAVMELNSKRRGLSPESLYRHYRHYSSTGDWRVLIDRAKAPVDRSVGVPLPFKEFWRMLCGRNQRKCAPAHAELLCIWRTHYDWRKQHYTEIPGYAEWPKAEPKTGLPAGWSYDNLINHAPDKYELTASRIGRAAASECRLKVYATRVGLRVGEYYEFDDHEFNLKVNFPGQSKPQRPRGFTVIDVLSSCAFLQSFKPTLWDEEAEAKRVLTEQDMMWFVVHTLTSVGYRTDERGTALVVEWGTAAIREAFEKRICEATGQHVRVERSGKFGRPAHAGQFDEKSKGNFRFKALVESFFNILDNHLASLPGQVGLDRNAAPLQLHGAEAYNTAMLKAQRSLPTPAAAAILFPFLTWPEFLGLALDAFRRINTDTEHNLEGWQRLGFVTKEWRLNEHSDWNAQDQFLALPEPQQLVVRSLMEQNHLLARVRQLSREEVFFRGAKELTRLRPFHFPALMGLENALRGGEPLAVRNGVFEFEDSAMGSDTFRFIAVDEYGQRLPEGEKYIGFVNPFNPDVLVACDARLRVVAECRPVAMPARNDLEGVKAAKTTAAKWEAKALARLGIRYGAEAKAKQAMHQHNAEVIAGALNKAAQIEDETDAALNAAMQG